MKNNHRIYLHSETTGKYAPTLHPGFASASAASAFAKATLKVESNLSGKTAFKVSSFGIPA